MTWKIIFTSSYIKQQPMAPVQFSLLQVTSNNPLLQFWWWRIFKIMEIMELFDTFQDLNPKKEIHLL